jgi:hypothetical protein
MKHLKKFEFYFYSASKKNRLKDEEEQDAFAPKYGQEDKKDFEVFHSGEGEEEDTYGEGEEEDTYGEEGECEECEDGDKEVKDWNDAQTLERVKSFGSFVNEEKKFSAAQLAAQKKFKERIKGKKSDDKEDDKKAPAKKGAKPDFLDLDKDGDKKEPMKKAAKDAKEADKKDAPIKKIDLKQRILKSQSKK